MVGDKEDGGVSIELDLDRFRGLAELISEQDIEQALRESGRSETRRCRLSLSVMTWIVLAMGIFTDAPLRTVLRHCRRHRPEALPSRSALCRGRQRLGPRPMRKLFERVVKPLCRPDVPGGYYKKYRLMGLDGSLYTVPDTPENELAFGRPQGGSCSTSSGGFPQVGKVSLVELGSHVEVAFTLRPLKKGEKTMAPRLFKHLTRDMLVCLDAGFYGYSLLRRLHDTGAEFLISVSSTPGLQSIQPLSDGSDLTRIYAKTTSRQNYGPGMLGLAQK